jgi:hypothetical protein
MAGRLLSLMFSRANLPSPSPPVGSCSCPTSRLAPGRVTLPQNSFPSQPLTGAGLVKIFLCIGRALDARNRVILIARRQVQLLVVVHLAKRRVDSKRASRSTPACRR